jgi:uncharacterized protein
MDYNLRWYNIEHFELIWENIEDFGCEYVKIQHNSSDIYANGTVIYLLKSKPYCFVYELVLDPFWITKKLTVKNDAIENIT